MSDQNTMNAEKKVKCPQCGHFAFYSKTNPFRPFCSERCRLLDLGQWANEDFRIPISSQSVTISTESIDLESEYE